MNKSGLYVIKTRTGEYYVSPSMLSPTRQDATWMTRTSALAIIAQYGIIGEVEKL